MGDATSILRCPVTHRPLRRSDEGRLATDQHSEYRVLDGIAVLLPAAAEISTSSSITEYYDAFGWAADADGVSKETKIELDTRKPAFDHTKKCISRLEHYFRGGGEYLLDVGSGAIPHGDLMAYHSRFQKRVCVDLSIKALQQAKSKLGDRGVYIVGDATKLPLEDGTIDAITCNHLIYQIPAELQAAAMMELWRVLKPGGVAVVVYRWQYSGISARLEKLATMLGLNRRAVKTGARDEPKAVPERDPDHPQPRSWFEAQRWPFQFSYDCFRIVDNEFMRRYVSDGWQGQAFLRLLYAAQQLLPGTCGRYGMFPAIIIRKPQA